MLPDPRKRATATLGAAVALLLATAVVGVWQLDAASVVKAPQGCGNCQGNNGNGAGNGSGTGVPGKALIASVAAVTDIAPGHDGRVTVSVHNPNSQPVDVTRVAGAVTGVGSGSLPGPECTPAMFTLADFTGSQRIDPDSSSTLPLTVHFVDLATNQDNCKGVRYTFSFTVYGQAS